LAASLAFGSKSQTATATTINKRPEHSTQLVFPAFIGVVLISSCLFDIVTACLPLLLVPINGVPELWFQSADLRGAIFRTIDAEQSPDGPDVPSAAALAVIAKVVARHFHD
jgi:hypothetical protein